VEQLTNNGKNVKPVIAITMGDAAGAGPEVIVKALNNPEISTICRPIVFGEMSIMNKATQITGKYIEFKKINSVNETQVDDIDKNLVYIVDFHNIDSSKFKPGVISTECGKASMEYIGEAARLAIKGEVQALVTAPINKEATVLAGYEDIGHLEYLARYCSVKQYATMLISGRLRTVHLTTHLSLKEACTMVTRGRISARLKLTHDAFKDWGFENPIIGVAALNPHGGEGGVMGREEMEEIVPAIKEAKESGIDARGPYPADSIFNRAINGEFDTVLTMYHDQGHIPVKVYGFEKSVSVALGLPFIRTSVDHGTAYDIAWQGKANSTSMEEAIKTAVLLCKRGRLEY
jgi:4-phospho-D-threonate 3-dehydrogenase / 4-phospho-D-erythronate 3-dehydrogenase